MDRGFYTSVSGMMCSTKKLSDISNNIANISTTGYKRDISIIDEFSDLVINKLNDDVNIGNMSNQVYINDTHTVFRDGSLSQTNLDTDYAISGDGFFKIEKNGQFVYTRDGSFAYDSEGYLVTSDGGYVLNKNNERILYQKDVDLSDDIMVVSFDDTKTLKKTNTGYYINGFGLSNEVPSDNYTLRQGYLELSNVEAADELSDLIKIQRYYQMNQRSLQVHDELLEKISQF